MQEISFEVDGIAVRGKLFVAESPKPLAFLLLQGWIGNQNTVSAQALAELGFTSMTFDMRGNKTSEGDLEQFSRADFLEETVAAYDYFRSKLGEGVQIVVVGSSFGSYIACLLSTRRPVVALSLRVPAGYPDDGFGESQLVQVRSDSLLAWRKQPATPAENKAYKAVHDFTGPIQIIEAGKDQMVAHQTTLNYVNAADDSKLDYAIMNNAPHELTTPELHEEYAGLLTSWATKVDLF